MYTGDSSPSQVRVDDDLVAAKRLDDLLLYAAMDGAGGVAAVGDAVSVLLGHSSIKVTQKHYDPWVKRRQAQLEEDGSINWDSDPLATLQERPKVVSIKR